MQMNRIASVPRYARASVTGLWAQHAPPPNAPRPFRACLHTATRMTETLWDARWAIIAFLRTGEPALAFDLRRRFGLTDIPDQVPLVGATLFAAPDPPQSPPACSVIIPVFNAARSVSQLLAHLPDTMADGQRVILVDDGSTDPAARAAVEQFAARWPATRVIRNQTNKGFVAAVGQATALADPRHHIVLLNADTLPPAGWLPRLLAPIARDATIASVTPLSNSAELLSVPQAGVDAQISLKFVAALDAQAQQLATRDISLPTGVGFCMALNRAFLDRIGGFDTAFGRGYGEEVDWCQRATQAGGRHVVATNLFVGHEGGRSFGQTTRARRIRRAGQMVAARHPGFPQAARQWQSDDPLLPERLALAIAWLNARATKAVPVYIAHLMGGGAETALANEVKTHLAHGQPGVVILRVGGPHLWRVELTGQRFALAGDIATTAVLHRLLDPLKNRRVIYSCGVGSADPLGLPGALCRLADGHSLALRLHDFYPISPSWNLIDSQGRFNGVPPIDTTDPAHSVRQAKGRATLPHRDWRAAWARVMDRADTIHCFAPSGAALLARAYPQTRDTTKIVPHQLGPVPGPLRKGGQTIGVLGGINLAKGGAVLERLARATGRRIVVIGELEKSFHLPHPHHVHGRYKPRQIRHLATKHQIGLWLIPSICPETFSFATHEALSTGLPTVSFDLGAQADALRAAPNGHVLSVSPQDGAALADAIDKLF